MKTLTDNQIKEPIKKIKDNIKEKTDKKGQYILGSILSQSVTDTITTYLNKLP